VSKVPHIQFVSQTFRLPRIFLRSLRLPRLSMLDDDVAWK